MRPRYIGLKNRHLQYAIDSILKVDEESRLKAQDSPVELLKEKLAIDVGVDLYSVDLEGKNTVLIYLPSEEHLSVYDKNDPNSFERVFMSMETDNNYSEKEDIVAKIVDHDAPGASKEKHPYCEECWTLFKKYI